MTNAEHPLTLLKHVVRLGLGAPGFLARRRTSDSAYQAMVSLFCATGGKSNDWLSRGISLLYPPSPLDRASGLLGELDQGRTSGIVEDIDRQGFHVFEQRLPEDLCNRLLEFALANPCVRRAPGGSGVGPTPVDAYERDRPEGVRYDFSATAVVNNPDVQRLMADQSFLGIAQAYLRCAPILDVMSLWWHTAHGHEPDPEAAQFWHFDMDRIKWLKFFVYLTDVGSANGPHSFVRGSHRTGGIPRALARKGYARLTDTEVAACYPTTDFIEFTGPRGTVIAEDTRGLHKGKMVESGDRLILQLQFSNSLFGGYYPPERITRVVNEDLHAMIGRHPRLYSSYYP